MKLNDVAANAVARWADPERRPLFKGSLIDWNAFENGGTDGRDPIEGCACAQGDILLHNGFGPADLKAMAQDDADERTAKLLGISISHAILLRQINDKDDGFPQNVLTNPESVLGESAHYILAFWMHIDGMTADDWKAARAARDARDAWAAWDASAARDARVDRDAWVVTYAAMAEIGGAKWLDEHKEGKFVFLPMFGFADPDAVLERYPEFKREG